MRYAALAITVLALGSAGPPAALAQSPSAFDGTWNGTGTLTAARGRGTACGGETTNGRMTVRNGQITMTYSQREGISFSGPVSADGRFDLTYGHSRLTGQFSPAGTGRANFNNPACERSWRFRRAAG